MPGQYVIDVLTEHSMALMLAREAEIHARLGRFDEARAEALEAVGLAERDDDFRARISALGSAGFVELTAGALDRALDHLAAACDLLRGLPEMDPALCRVVSDAVEVLCRLGRLEEAEGQVVWLETRTHAHGGGHSALALWARGYLRVARGDRPGAIRSFGRALAALDEPATGFERARVLLALGEARRRCRQKDPTREALTEAIALFECAGAPAWAAIARRELASIGGVRSTPVAGLTQMQDRVARLAAVGWTNRQIAHELRISERTVEGHLSEIYRRLHLTSRAQLAAAWARRAAPNQDPRGSTD